MTKRKENISDKEWARILGEPQPEKAGSDDMDTGVDDRKNLDVGYGRPPKHTRFKPGHSGNRKGRPKQSKNVNTIIKDVIYQPVEVTLDGKKRRITVLEATLRRLASQAISKNDRKAAEQLVNFAFRAGASEIAPSEQVTTPAEDDVIVKQALERMIAEREAAELEDDVSSNDEPET